MDFLLHLLEMVLILVLVGFGVWLIATKFFGGHRYAMWAGGVVVIIVLLWLIGVNFNGSMLAWPHPR